MASVTELDSAKQRARQHVAGEVRAALARARIPASRLPLLIGKSQSYWSRRLCGDAPFDTDDLESLASLLEQPAAQFLARPKGFEPLTFWSEAAA